MAIVLSGTTGIDAGSLPVSNCGNTEVEGNLNLSGVGARITGDFSNSTVSNRVTFQTSTLNSNTIVCAIPNGTATESYIAVRNNSDANNSSFLSLGVTSSSTVVDSRQNGTGSYLPLVFNTGNAERMRIDTAGNVGIGTGSNINAKLDVQGSIRQYNPGTTANTVINHVNDAKNWYVGLRGDSSNAYSIADETRQRLLLDTTGNTLHLSPLGGLGYGTGAGGTVTQLTSKSTAVTLNKPTGQIIMNNAALAAGSYVIFDFVNNIVNEKDGLVLGMKYDGISAWDYSYWYVAYSGGYKISVKNNGVSSRSDALIINFQVIKGANA